MDLPSKRICSAHPMHFVLLADDGRSMEGERARDATLALRAWLCALQTAAAGRSRARFFCSLILFGASTETVIENVDPCGLAPEEFAIPGGNGPSRVAPAIAAAHRILASDGSTSRYCPPFVFVCSAGAIGAPSDALATASELKSLRLACGPPSIVALGLGEADGALLRRLASAPPLYIEARGAGGIAAIFPDIATPRTRDPGQTVAAFTARIAGVADAPSVAPRDPPEICRRL